MVFHSLLSGCRPRQAPRIRMGLLLLSSMLLGGCTSEHVLYPVDADQARSILREVLQSWKDGHSIASWHTKDPEVIVQDLDWMSGAKLDDFEIIGEGEAIDANLHCTVKLHLQDPKSGNVQREVTYLVGTHPKRTVFRHIMP